MALVGKGPKPLLFIWGCEEGKRLHILGRIAEHCATALDDSDLGDVLDSKGNHYKIRITAEVVRRQKTPTERLLSAAEIITGKRKSRKKSLPSTIDAPRSRFREFPRDHTPG